ncbi:hypothetical protein JX265_010222 [Neoarthrinium moseri]|uniref:Fibroin-3 related protein n=1 Tax=Neoarthrinium moseri TaxID=1658444 RepID=A0A9Q0ALX7_9PEZI|nr:hypothetical protein JX265_010222 [Neoarthrinium moseri]
MPHIGAVMERSLSEPQGLGEALRDLVVRSVVAGMTKRDIGGSISNVKTAFSSWDNCMQATYCKWPVIAVIVIGGLIIFSIVWCIVRCCCCGLSCCCECCYCLKCCGSCFGCCDPPQKKKYLDDPYIPPHHNQGQGGYRTEAPMTAAHSVPHFDGAVAKPEPPQYAEFETGKKAGGDELPAMPSWEGANSKKVLLEEEDAVELEQLKKPEASQNAPLMAPGSMSHPSSPNPGNSPYGAPVSQQQGSYYGNNGYGQMSRDNVSQGYDQNYGASGYGNQGYGAPGYGAAAGAMGAMGAAGAMGQQRTRTPHQDYNNGGGYGRGPMDQGYPQSRTPRPYDEYSRSGTPRSGTPGGGAYGRPPPGRSPAPPNGPYGNPGRMQSPAPSQRGYGYPQRSHTQDSYNAMRANAQDNYAPQRSYTQDGYGRQLAANPQRQYSSDSTVPLTRPETGRQYSDASFQQEPVQPSSPIQNSGGFDFTSGYSRSTPDIAPRPSPPPQQANGGGAAYPGYRAYKPQGQ